MHFFYWPVIIVEYALLVKRLLHTVMRYHFGDYSYSTCLWGLKADYLAEFMVFLFIVFTIVFNVYFGKSVKTFIDIGENACMSIPKCHWMVIVVNLVKQTWFLNDAASWCGFVYAGSVSGIPASNGDNCRYAS